MISSYSHSGSKRDFMRQSRTSIAVTPYLFTLATNRVRRLNICAPRHSGPRACRPIADNRNQNKINQSLKNSNGNTEMDLHVYISVDTNQFEGALYAVVCAACSVLNTSTHHHMWAWMVREHSDNDIDRVLHFSAWTDIEFQQNGT